MKRKVRYSLLCILLLFSSVTTGYAQRGYTMNFLSLVPQQNKFNPAYYTRYGVYVGIPMVSNVQFQVFNDAFTINRTFIQRLDTKLIDPVGIISGLSIENNIGLEFNMDFLSFGFKVREHNQFHVGFGREGYFNALLTKSTLSLLLTGSGNFLGERGTNALSGNSFDMSIYDALSLGYSREVNERLSVGGRLKFLSGIANLYTVRSNVELFIDDGHDPNIVPYTRFIKPDIALNGSFSNLPRDSSLLYVMRNFQSVALESLLTAPNPTFNNFGIGIDLGAVYQVSEYVTLAASVHDIGFINWNTGVQRISSQQRENPFVFSGVGQFSDIINDIDGLIIQDIFTALVDSLIDYFQLQEVDTTLTSYRSSLRTSYNLSFFYNVTDNDQIGVMWNSKLGRRKYNALTIAYTRSLGRGFQICINNAIINNNAFNFGGGFVFNVGALQLYAVVDKISSFNVVDWRAANVQFGINLGLNRTEKDPNKRRLVRDFTPRDRTGYVNDRWAW